jgi:alkylation response protein AidB-like acyl-CoA dehydrogenase
MTDVTLSEEQELLVDTCRRLVDRVEVRPPEPEQALVRDEAAWSSLVELGLVGVHVPEALGGVGGSAVDAALVVEQLARGPVPVPYLGTVVAAELLVAAGPDDAEVAGALGAVVAGEPCGVVLDADLRSFADIGRAVDAVPGQRVVGLDRRGGGGGQVTLGVAGTAAQSADLARPMVHVAAPEADGVALAPIGARLERDAGVRAEAFALALVCADLLGAAEAALDGAVAHAAERRQFGRPVGSFQAVQHLCADALVSVEASRSVVWHAAWAVDAEAPAEALRAARVAKAWCSAAALEVVEAAVQVWGGLGITWECPVHLFQRRVLLGRRLFGDDAFHLDRLGRQLLGSALARTGGGGAR